MRPNQFLFVVSALLALAVGCAPTQPSEEEKPPCEAGPACETSDAGLDAGLTAGQDAGLNTDQDAGACLGPDGGACVHGDCSAGACNCLSGWSGPNCDTCAPGFWGADCQPCRCPDDNNPCTDESCDSAGNCIHADNTLPCDDGNACTDGDTCFNGICSGTIVVTCDDRNPCTRDSCDPATGCVTAAEKDGTACLDGNACTSGEVCRSGRCSAGQIHACALEATPRTGIPPFSSAISIADLPAGATVTWRHDGVVLGTGDLLNLSVASPGPNDIFVEVATSAESTRLGPVAVWGAAPIDVGSAIIGPEGGAISLDSAASLYFRSATLVVPPGALRVPLEIKVREWPDLRLPELPADGSVLELLPHTTVFDKPVQLWVPVLLDEETLSCASFADGVRGFYAASGPLEQYPVAEVDCPGRRVRLDIPHFSPFSFVRRMATDLGQGALDAATIAGGMLEKIPGAVKTVCKYKALVPSKPLRYSCDTYGKYAYIYKDTKKALKHMRTAQELLAIHAGLTSYGPQEIDRALVEPALDGYEVPVDVTLAEAHKYLAIHDAMVAATTQQDFAGALELLRYYQAEDGRYEYIKSASLAVAERLLSASGMLATVAPLLSAQLEAAFNIVRSWDESAQFQQYLVYESGRSTGALDFVDGRLVVRDPNALEFVPTDPVGHPDLVTGWFPFQAAYPSGVTRDPYHFAAFEILYRLKRADRSTLVADLNRSLARLAEIMDRLRLGASPGWVWNVTTLPPPQGGNPIASGGCAPGDSLPCDLDISVDMEASQSGLSIDLSASAGSVDWVAWRLRAGGTAHGVVLDAVPPVGQPTAPSGRAGLTYSTGPLEPGDYLITGRVVRPDGPAQLNVHATVRPSAPPNVSFLAPSAGAALDAAHPFSIRVSAVDAEDGIRQAERVSAYDAAGKLVWSTHSGSFNGTEVVTTAQLPAGSYLLRAEALDTRGNRGTGELPITVAACTPSCQGASCGPDGCGGSCGSCGPNSSCSAGTCVSCIPSCAGRSCGDDGCGGSCGVCQGSWCSPAGRCEPACVPNCANRQCGDNGCQGSCGACSGGLRCDAIGTCSLLSAFSIQGNWVDVDTTVISVQQLGDALTCSYSNGRGPFPGRFLAAYEVKVDFDATCCTGMVSTDGRSINWSNATSWSRQ